MTCQDAGHRLALDMLRAEADMWKRLSEDGPAPFKQWLLDNGELCGPRIGVRGLPMMKQKQCYSNSLRTLYWREADDNEWFYTEGVVAASDLPLLIDHAWLTSRDGRVLDRTLRPREGVTFSYFGIPFEPQYAKVETMKHGYYGLFSNGVTYNREIVGQPVTDGRAWERRVYAEE